MNASPFGKDARGEAREEYARISWVPKEEERSIRRSRRLQGLTPDNTATMNNRSEATTQVSPLFCQNVVRNPSMFSGEISEDPQAWLKGYERVARHNHWDDSLSLANVYFYLHGTAQRWYENNEENIPSWEIFKDQLGSVFGKKDNLRRQAEQKLKVRAQTRGETTEFYIQDVLRLCREVDAQMPEEERLSHLMKGVAKEVYRYLLPRDIATTDQVSSRCGAPRTTSDSLKIRALDNVTSLGDLGDATDLQSLIRQIVREEVQRALAPPREEPRISSLEEIVKEEVDKVLAPMSGINTFPMESAAWSAPRNYRKNTWYAPKTRKFPWSQCYKTSQPVSSAFTIGKLRAAPSNGGEAAAQPIIPPLSTVVKMTNNYIDIKIEGDTIRALVDSGASYSVISERFRVELKKTMFAETDVVLKVADDKVVKSKGRCTLKLEVNGHPENFEFVVLENCSHDVILGWDFFKATNAVIDCGLGELQLDDLPDLDAEGRDDGVYAIQDFVIPGRSSQRISVVNRSLIGIVNMEVTCSKELFIRKDVIFPSSLIEFEEGLGKIWITNGGLQPQMIPKGMNLGRMCDIETEHVCLLSVEPESFSKKRITGASAVCLQKAAKNNLIRAYSSRASPRASFPNGDAFDAFIFHSPPSKMSTASSLSQLLGEHPDEVPNTAQQGSTRFSPFFLVHGREAETLLDVLLPYEDETSDHDFGGQMVTKAEEARQLARIHILRDQENNKYHYDQVHRSVEYRVGDLVWVFTPVRKTGLSEKLLKKYFGPYKITRKVSEVNYEVEALEQSSRRRRRSQKDVVHVLRMKPYRDPGQQLVTGDYNSWDSEDAVDILEGGL
ncbi:K02A2.6-like [Cordylochernes scorpioides]|uniref:K02A2.6-like n=1 Tax=Cordylochernes scorpioides TaxID=51811 RepID=A0ABY6KN87_9ARAC|nr:K02A2.6-like [Cordylochernes scorpioides]